MTDDRGTIERVDLVIRYPSGVKKHVTLSNNPNDAKHNHHVLSAIVGIYFGAHGKVGSVEEHLRSVQGEGVSQKWNRISEGDDYKPAMILLNLDGSVQVLCGGHKNGPHPEPRLASDREAEAVLSHAD